MNVVLMSLPSHFCCMKIFILSHKWNIPLTLSLLWVLTFSVKYLYWLACWTLGQQLFAQRLDLDLVLLCENNNGCHSNFHIFIYNDDVQWSDLAWLTVQKLSTDLQKTAFLALCLHPPTKTPDAQWARQTPGCAVTNLGEVPVWYQCHFFFSFILAHTLRRRTDKCQCASRLGAHVIAWKHL